MLRSLARLSASASSHRDLSLADFITNTAESDFRYTQVERGECIKRARLPTLFDDGARDRMQRVRHRLDQGAHCEIALSHPWPFVKETSGLVEGRDVDFDDACAKRRTTLERLPVSLGRLLIAKENALTLRGRAEPHVGRKSTEQTERPVAQIGISWIGSSDRRQCGPGVIRGQRKDRHTIERPARRNNAGVRDEAKTGLQTDNVVQRRGHAAGASSVGAKREWHEARRDRHRRARA